ncbi:MAG: ABC transporter permease [Bacteroidales bacterium]|nr:ABC transporter permease [Bacteroidales bacterium]
MKRFRAFIIKEFRHLFRDWRTAIVLFTIPLIQLMLFGYVITTEIKNARIAILDFSNDEITHQITNKLLASGYFILDAGLKSIDEVEPAFQKGKIKEVIVFEPDFGQKLIKTNKASIQILTDASDPNMASLLDTYTRSIIVSFQNELNKNQPQGKHIITEFRMFYNEGLRSAYMFVPGTMAMILMLISALMTSVSIAREKEMGTMEILLVSPLKPSQIILGKLIPYMALAFADMLVILLIGHVVFGVPVRGNLLLLIGTGTLFILLALSLGVLISTIARTQQVAMIISLIGLMLPTILLSGFIFPIENMPEILQWFSVIMPPRWFLSAIKDIMLKGAGISYVWDNLLIMAFMMLFFILLSIKKFKTRLE